MNLSLSAVAVLYYIEKGSNQSRQEIIGNHRHDEGATELGVSLSLSLSLSLSSISARAGGIRSQLIFSLLEQE